MAWTYWWAINRQREMPQTRLSPSPFHKNKSRGEKNLVTRRLQPRCLQHFLVKMVYKMVMYQVDHEVQSEIPSTQNEEIGKPKIFPPKKTYSELHAIDYRKKKSFVPLICTTESYWLMLIILCLIYFFKIRIFFKCIHVDQ